MLSRAVGAFLGRSLLPRLPMRLFAELPEHQVLGMPLLSPTMTKGTIAKWNKKVGDKLKPGDILMEVETDKATVGYEVTDEGYLAKIILPEGAADVELGVPIAVIVDESGAVLSFKDFQPKATAPQAQPSSTPAAPAQSAPAEEAKTSVSAPPPKTTDRVFISPLARRLSTEQGINLTGVTGSGPNNRIIKADVLSAAEKQKQAPKPSAAAPTAVPPARAGYKDIPHSSIRKIIAERLLQSKQTIPHYYLTVDCEIDKLLQLRTQLNGISGVKISVNDMVIKCAAMACIKVPTANSAWLENSQRIYEGVDMSVAVQTEKGLLTPIVKNAHTKRLGEIAGEMKELADKAKAGKLKPEEFQGGTFTVSNLGMFGVSEFSAIINPPQACILAVGAGAKKVLPDEQAGFRTATVMTVTLSCDHRAVDGAVGAQWLQAFKSYVESPISLLV